MRANPIKLACTSAVALGLYSLFFSFLGRYVFVADWSQLTEIEMAIFVTMVLRAIIVGTLEFKFQIQPIIPILVFSVEALLIPPLLVMIILTGAQYYATVMGVILTAWFGASALILTPYTIFFFSRSMARDTSLSSVMFVGILEFAVDLFLAVLLVGSSATIVGLTGLGTLIISQIRGYVSAGGFPSPAADFLTSGGLVLFFLGMLFYFTLGGRTPNSQVRLPFAMVFPLTAILIAFMWVAIGLQINPDLLLVLSAPAVAIAGIVWLVASLGK